MKRGTRLQRIRAYARDPNRWDPEPLLADIRALLRVGEEAVRWAQRGGAYPKDMPLLRAVTHLLEKEETGK
jgi:hypothetical protein